MSPRDEREETHFDPEFSRRVRGAITEARAEPPSGLVRRARGPLLAAGALGIAGILAWSLGATQPAAALPVAELQRACEAEDYAAADALLGAARGKADARLLSRWETVCVILRKESEARSREAWSASLDHLGILLETARGSAWAAREASRRRSLGERAARLSAETARVKDAAGRGDWREAASLLDALARSSPGEPRLSRLEADLGGAAWDAVRQDVEPLLAEGDWEGAYRVLRGEAGGAAACGLPAVRRRCQEELSQIESARRAEGTSHVPSSSQEEKALSLYREGKGAAAILACPAGSLSGGKFRLVHDAYESGLRSLTGGDLPSAARSFRAILAAEPDPACWYRRGAEEALSGIVREAEPLLDGWAREGEARRAKGDLKEALLLLQNVLAIDPGHAEAAAGLQAMRDDAERLYEEAYVLLDLDPAKARVKLRLLDEILPPEHPLKPKVRAALSGE